MCKTTNKKRPDYCQVVVFIVIPILAMVPYIAYPTIINVPGDYQTISEAVTYAEDWDTVLVAPGTYNGLYYRGNNESPEYVTLMGSGWPNGTTIIYCPSASEQNAFEIEYVNGWRITNFEITNCGDALRHYGVTKFEIDHNYMHGMTYSYWACGILGDSTYGMSIHHNLIEDCDYGGILFGWSGDVINGVHVYNNTIVHIDSYDGIQFRNHTPINCVVTNNIIVDCGEEGIEFALCSQGNTDISYNCIYQVSSPWSNVPNPGPGNI